MECIYVDTALLAVPNYAIDEATAGEIIDRVNHFAQLASPSVPIQLVLATEAEAVLWNGNCGPSYEQIAAFVELMGVGHIFSARDLIQQYQTILDRSVRADSIVPLEVQRVSVFNTLPALPADLGPQFLRSETERIFATVAVLQSVASGWSIGPGIYGVNGRSYLIEARIEEATGSKAAELGDLPVNISAEVRAIGHLRELISTESAHRLWVDAKTPEELHFAITIGALAILKDSREPSGALGIRRFTIGPDFLRSIRDTQCFSDGRFASTTHTLCSQIIAKLCTRPIKEFGKSKQESRPFDPALGWRVHITAASEGLRLMLWDDGTMIEFANVGVKHEETISIGTRNGGVDTDIRYCI